MNEQQKITVKPEQLDNVICSEQDCGSATFNLVYALKIVPATLSPNGKSFIQPIQLYKCEKCGQLCGEMAPAGVLNKFGNNGENKKSQMGF